MAKLETTLKRADTTICANEFEQRPGNFGFQNLRTGVHRKIKLNIMAV